MLKRRKCVTLRDVYVCPGNPVFEVVSTMRYIWERMILILYIRPVCLLILGRYQERLMENTDKMLFNLEEMVSNIDFAKMEAKVVDGIEAGNTALKLIQEVSPKT